MQTFNGLVKSWDESQGYGLVRPDGVQDGALDIVVRRSVLGPQEICVGCAVQLEADLSEAKTSYEATKCVVVGAPMQQVPQVAQVAQVPQAQVVQDPCGGCCAQQCGYGCGGCGCGGCCGQCGGCDACGCGACGKCGACQGQAAKDALAAVDVGSAEAAVEAACKGCKWAVPWAWVLRPPAMARLDHLAGAALSELFTNLFITGLPAEIDEKQLRELFTFYGTVVRCKAAWIVQNLNGNVPAGLTNPIKVVFSQSRGKMAQRQSQYQQGPYDQQYGCGGCGCGGCGCGGCGACGCGGCAFPAGLEIKMATHTNDAGNKIWVGQIPLGTHKDVKRRGMYSESVGVGVGQRCSEPFRRPLRPRE
eukprot:g5056.t1